MNIFENNDSPNNNLNDNELFYKDHSFKAPSQINRSKTPQQKSQVLRNFEKVTQICFSLSLAFLRIIFIFIEPSYPKPTKLPPSIHLAHYIKETTTHTSESPPRQNLEEFKKFYREIYEKYKEYNYLEALEKMEEAHEISQKCELNKESAGYFRAFFNMRGDIMMMTKNYKEAEEFFEKSLDIIYEYFPRDDLPLIYSHTNLGELYFRQGKFEESERLLTQCLELRKIQKQCVYFGYIKLAMLYTKWEKLDKARECLNKSLENIELLTERDKEILYGRYHRNWGQIHFKEGKLEDAKESYKKAIRFISANFPEGNDFTKILQAEYQEILASEPESDTVKLVCDRLVIYEHN